jgi:hypothetical protein
MHLTCILYVYMYLDCMAGINMELKPEVKILDRKLDCSLTPPSCRAHESHQRAHAESSTLHLRGVSQGTQGRYYTVSSLIAGRLLLITMLGPLLPVFGGRLAAAFAACSSRNSFALLLHQPLLQLLRRDQPTTLLLPVAGRQASLAVVASMGPWPPLRMYVLTMRL